MFITSFHEPARRHFSKDDRYLIKDNATTHKCDVIAAETSIPKYNPPA